MSVIGRIFGRSTNRDRDTHHSRHNLQITSKHSEPNNDSILVDPVDVRIGQEAEAVRRDFDEEHYLLQNPDVAEAKIDPLLHFLRYGWKEGRDPNASFSVSYYLEANPDIRDAKVNPFWHYVVAGKAEGRAPVPPQGDALAHRNSDDNRITQEMQAIRGEFDSEYYLRHNPDVAEAKIDPLLHFLRSGWMEGRNPNGSFSVDYYLEANPDVRNAKVNPFWHYVVAGKAEGRSARHPGGYRAETLIHTRPLEEVVKEWRTQQTPELFLAAEDLCRRVLSGRMNAIKTLMISIGHDNYHEVSGGVQYCIQREEESAASRGIVYLNLHPYQPLPRLAHVEEEPDTVVSLLLEGEAIGTARMSAVAKAARMLTVQGGSIEVVIHHLLGHSPEQIAEMVRATGSNRCWLWLHDFFTLCPNFVLQRNNVSFCGAPSVSSNSCRLCLYGAERVKHLERMTAFFDAIDVHVIAPSQFAADFWTARTGLPAASVTIQPHAAIEWSNCKLRPAEDGKITVAFVGYPASHKGWPVFENIVRTFRGNDSDFEFVYFGTSHIGLDQVDTVPVHVTAEEPDAMIRALADRRVDFVLHWASWGETFSFSTHEALAAGAYVLTNAGSGNVAATVQRLDRGAVLADETELEAFFRDGRALAMAKELRARRRAQRAVMTRSDMSLEVLQPGARK